MLVTQIIIQNVIAGKSQAAAQGGLGGQEGDKCCSYKSSGMSILVLVWHDNVRIKIDVTCMLRHKRLVVSPLYR